MSAFLKICRKKLPTIMLAAALCASLMKGGALAADSVAVDSAHFPDAAFRSVVSGEFDTNGDGLLSQQELSAAKELNCFRSEIADLTGLSYFTELETLVCSFNRLTSLDVSGNPKLQTLACANNSLTALNIRGSTELRSLNCSWNSLTSLDVSGNAKLESLICEGNPLSSINVGSNASLSSLNVSNTGITALDVTKNSSLTSLLCAGNALSALDIRSNASLSTLDCSSNAIASLDVSACARLVEAASTGDRSELVGIVTFLSDSGSVLSIDSETNLIGVSAGRSVPISEANFPDASFRAYVSERLDRNGDGVLSDSEIGAVTSLSFDRYEIEDMTGIAVFSSLTYLSCSGNYRLVSLDVSHNTALQELYCQDNALTSLLLGDNKALKRLDCSGNALAEVDIRGCPILIEAAAGEKRTASGVAEYGKTGGVFTAVITCDASTSILTGGTVFIRGDVNGDGSVDASDAAQLMRLLLSGGTLPAESDANRDGSVNILDVIRILQSSVGIDIAASGSDAGGESTSSDA